MIVDPSKVAVPGVHASQARSGLPPPPYRAGASKTVQSFQRADGIQRCIRQQLALEILVQYPSQPRASSNSVPGHRTGLPRAREVLARGCAEGTHRCIGAASCKADIELDGFCLSRTSCR